MRTLELYRLREEYLAALRDVTREQQRADALRAYLQQRYTELQEIENHLLYLSTILTETRDALRALELSPP